MCNIKKISEGITGQEAADIIYDNDSALKEGIARLSGEKVSETAVGQANGVAGLDKEGRVPKAQLPAALPADGGNADTLEGLGANDFARTGTLAKGVDLDTVNGAGGFWTSPININATPELHYPIQEAGILIYGRAAGESACQIYGSYRENRWFCRGGGYGPSQKTDWAEFWTTLNFDPADYLPLAGGKVLTGDVSIRNGKSLKSESDSGVVVGLTDTMGDGIQRTTLGSTRRPAVIVTDGTPVKRQDGSGAYKMWDASNFDPADYMAIDRSQPGTGSSKIWVGTQAQYDAIATKSAETLYFIQE